MNREEKNEIIMAHIIFWAFAAFLALSIKTGRGFFIALATGSGCYALDMIMNRI